MASGFPEWIESIFADRQGCTKCKHRLSVHDIDSIGVCYPGKEFVHNRRPQAVLLVTCAHCDRRHQFSMGQPRDDILGGVGFLYDFIEMERPSTEKPSPFPTSSSKAPLWDCEDNEATKEDEVEGHDKDDHDSSADGTVPSAIPKPNHRDGKVRPSRRSTQPRTQPTDKEIRTFMNALRLTSFKRSSKSYRRFMAKIGVNMKDEKNNK